MIVKAIKKRISKKTNSKNTSAKAKKVNWDKYFGKITFPLDGITLQRKMRDEWEQ